MYLRRLRNDEHASEYADRADASAFFKAPAQAAHTRAARRATRHWAAAFTACETPHCMGAGRARHSGAIPPPPYPPGMLPPIKPGGTGV